MEIKSNGNVMTNETRRISARKFIAIKMIVHNVKIIGKIGRVCTETTSFFILCTKSIK